jgi:translocation and assembly module TamB
VADDFRRILKNPSLPRGVISLDGSLNYQSEPNRPALETVSLDGRMSSRELSMKTPSVNAQIRDLGAHYKIQNGNAEVENIHANLLGGSLDGKLVIRDLAGASRARFQAAIKNISLQDAAAASGNRSTLEQARLTGRFNANADATWAKTMSNLIAHADATIQAAIGKGTPTPLNGVIHADYAAAHKELGLNQSYIKTPQTTITMNGHISQNCNLAVRMQSNNLHELELLADNFRKPTPGQPQEPMDLYGTATLNASVTGSTSNPRINGQLLASNLKVKGSSWRVLRTNIDASPSRVSLSNGDLEAATQGRINFNVEARLDHWKYTPSSPISVQLSAAQLSVADLERLANKTYPITGTLAVNVSVHGTQLNPVGQGNISLVNAKVSNEPIQSVNLRFQGNGNAVDANLNVKMPAGTTQAYLTYFPKTEAYQAQLQTNNLRLEKLRTVQDRNLQINGGLNLNASGRGTLKSPELTASLQIPTLQVQKQTIKGITFNADVRDHIANLALNSDVAETYVKASGTVGIEAPYMANLRLDTGRINFQPLVAIYAPAQAPNMGGQTELHATLRGPLAEKSRMEAHIEVPVLTANYKDVKLAATKPIRLDYQNEVATLQPTAIQGTGTDIQMQGRVPINNRKAASFLVEGTVDLQVAQMLMPDVQSSGQLKFDVNSQKYGGGNIQGHIQVVNANFQSQSAPLGLTNGNGVIDVTRDRLQIVNLQGQVGGGTITAKGGVAYHPSVQFDLGLAANNIRLRYPDGVRAVLTSNLSLTGTPQAGLLAGQVRIEHVSFTNDFDLSNFIDQFSGESSSPPSPGLAENIKLNITVQSTSQMNLVSSQVSLQGNANLRVAGTAADPVILGRATLTGGELFLRGKRFVIQNGTIAFLNPVETEPVVNLQVNTTVEQYNIALHFQGPVQHLRTTYTSDPALPPVDIINLLVRGQTTEQANANPTNATLGAESLVAGQVTGQLSSKIQKFAGISNLSIDPTLGGDQNNPGARVAIQQRVTGNLYVTFATDVTSTQREEIQIEYKFNPRWSVSGTRDQNGGFALDGKYHKSF